MQVVPGTAPRGRGSAAGEARRRGRGTGSFPWLLVCLVGTLLATGCAGPGADVHLAPFYTRMNTGDGGVETEALGGFLQRRRNAESGRFESATVGPLWSTDVEENGDWVSHFLVPLGRSSGHGESGMSVLFPVYYYRKLERADGSKEWGLLALPGVLVRSNEVHGTEVGWFPFWGRFENFLTFDHLCFFLWPLYVHAERDERVSRNYLFPLVGWTRGGGETSHRLFPLYGRARREGRYDRTFVLWPFLQFQRNNLGGGDELPEHVWWIFPLAGRKTRGSWQATTLLWPFFGYASDPRSGFVAFDAPWPFIRYQRGPDDIYHARVWPLWSHWRGDGIENWSWLWPIGHYREERFPTMERDSLFIVPFWQSWERRDLLSGRRDTWQKLFPLYQHEREGEGTRGSFPTLDPFWKNKLIDRHFSWMWKLWEWEQEGPMRRERSFLGLWKRERDAGEDRKSITGLWSRRRYFEGRTRIKETSLLFGLFRWRVTEGEGFDMLPPAFPGPGWPAERHLPDEGRLPDGGIPDPGGVTP